MRLEILWSIIYFRSTAEQYLWYTKVLVGSIICHDWLIDYKLIDSLIHSLDIEYADIVEMEIRAHGDFYVESSNGEQHFW